MSALKAGGAIYLLEKNGLLIPVPKDNVTPDIIDILQKQCYNNIEAHIKSQIKSFEFWQQNPDFNNKRKKQ